MIEFLSFYFIVEVPSDMVAGLYPEFSQQDPDSGFDSGPGSSNL